MALKRSESKISVASNKGSAEDRWAKIEARIEKTDEVEDFLVRVKTLAAKGEP